MLTEFKLRLISVPLLSNSEYQESLKFEYNFVLRIIRHDLNHSKDEFIRGFTFLIEDKDEMR